MYKLNQLGYFKDTRGYIATYIPHGRDWQEGQWQTYAFVILEESMNSLFCYIVVRGY